ncbi:hypothetical protein BC943DRAFT_179564 [Umbelopsis sp. AD052]|nr:hypothetical protein BC943DRAFT_179564 [Umbelopsis sp. AD052]
MVWSRTPKSFCKLMSSHAPHSHNPLTAIGFSIGFVGIVGLVISLIALIPLNAYNIALAIQTITKLQIAYGRGSILIPGPYQPVQVFLLGTIAFSVITILLLLATCWRNASARNRPQRSRRAKRVGRERRGSKASSIAESIHSVQSELSSSSQSTFLQNPSSSWISRFSTMSFILQFCWAIFGSHTLYFTVYEEHPLPAAIMKAATTCLLILWTNYAIMICFSIVFCFAACCVLIGGISSSAYDEEDELEDQQVSERSPLLTSTNTMT